MMYKNILLEKDAFKQVIEKEDTEIKKLLFGNMFYFLAENIVKIYNLSNQKYKLKEYEQFPIETFEKYLNSVGPCKLDIQKIKEYINVERQVLESIIETKLNIERVYRVLSIQAKRFERALEIEDFTVSNYILVDALDQLISNVRTYEIAYKDEIERTIKMDEIFKEIFSKIRKDEKDMTDKSNASKSYIASRVAIQEYNKIDNLIKNARDNNPLHSCFFMC